jgi:hypothetical protein
VSERHLPAPHIDLGNGRHVGWSRLPDLEHGVSNLYKGLPDRAWGSVR